MGLVILFHDPRISGAEQIIKYLIMHFPRSSFYLTALSFKYFPHHPVLRHDQCVSFRQNARPSFTTELNEAELSMYEIRLVGCSSPQQTHMRADRR
jgi:hypothetical protein